MKKVLTILTTLACTANLSAQTPLAGATQEAPIEIKAGECYLLPQDFSNAYFTFQSETDGLLYLSLSKPLKIFGGNGPLPLYEKECVQGIEAGEVYTFYNTTTWGDSITMTVSFVEGKTYLPIALTSTSLAEGSIYRSSLQDGDITFAFNVAINPTIVKAEVELSDGERIGVNNYRTSEDYNTQGTNYVLQLAQTYEALVENGKLKEGDTFCVVLSNIASTTHADNVYEGEIRLGLKSSGKTVTLESVSNQEKLQSYYMPGDEAGLITLTFTGPVTCSAQSAILAYGDREAGTWAEVKVPYTVEGNTITWNVQGIHLTNVPADDEGNRYVSISLKNICDKDGFPIKSNAIGSTGTILFSYLIETMDINIYPDFLPAIGSNIDDTKEVEIWISAGKYVTFSGAKVSYQQNGETIEKVIPLEELRQEDDPYVATDLLVYVPVADYPFEAGEVTVELTDVSAANGTSPEIKASYQSTGSRVDHINTPTTPDTEVTNLWNIDGTPVSPTQPLKRGIYLQKSADGKTQKLIR